MSPTALLDEARQKTLPWLEPIAPSAPTGVSARQEPAYEQLLQEVAKLESPSAGAVDWAKVAELGGSLLKRSSKDLLVASYVAYSWYASRGAEGLLEGTALLTELMERYWEQLFPEVSRVRARVNALSWFVQRASLAVPALPVTGTARNTLAPLDAAARRLAELSREKLAAQSPGFGPLLEALARLKLSVPEVAAPPAAPPPLPSSTEPARAAAPTPPPSSPPPPVAPQGPALAEPAQDAASAAEYLRKTGAGLLEVAMMLRRADPSDPAAYRLLRNGLWLHLGQAPQAGPQGRTSLPPLAPAVRASLEALAANAKWLELIDAAESALLQNRFNLDLHAATFQGLKGLGASHQAARRALTSSLAEWLARVPGVELLLTQDGSPVASPSTRVWLTAEVLPAPAPAPSSPSGAAAEEDGAEALRKAQTLFSQKKISEGVELLHAAAEKASSRRARFLLLLELAQRLAEAGQTPVARGLYASLEREGREHHLDLWEPAVSARCLEGLLVTARLSLPKSPPSEVLQEAQQRLCRIAPNAALRLEG